MSQGFFVTPKWEAFMMGGLIPRDLGLEADHYEWFCSKCQQVGLDPASHVQRRDLRKIGFSDINCTVSEDFYKILLSEANA